MDRAAIRSMTTLNSTASAAAITSSGVHAMTDITGFGLMGHGREMALGSGVALEIEAASVPLIAGALDAVRPAPSPAGLLANREFAECLVADAPGSAIPDDVRTLLYRSADSGRSADLCRSGKCGGVARIAARAGLPAATIGR